jgi:hypothetical protein
MTTYDANEVVYVHPGELPMKKITDVATASVTYVGYAPIGTSSTATAWRISRTTVSGSATTLEWAGTAATFTKNWGYRAALNYG